MKTLFKIIGVIIVGVGLVSYFSPEARKTLSDMTSIFKPSPADTRPQTPSHEAVTQLIKNNMQRFAISVNNKNMSEFYNQISDFWQEKTTVNELNKVFAPFINSGIDLTALKKMTPIIDKGPLVTDNADLQVSGHYNTTPSQVHFKQTYYLEESKNWKLSEFFIEIKKK